jgi:hypothetical protein
VSDNDFEVLMKKKLMNVAVGLGVAGAIGIAAVGIGTAAANAAPLSPATQTDFAQWGPGWGPGPGPWRPGPPPPPPPAWGYNYGGYDNYGGYNNYGPPPPPCISGPLGFLQVCP